MPLPASTQRTHKVRHVCIFQSNFVPQISGEVFLRTMPAHAAEKNYSWGPMEAQTPLSFLHLLINHRRIQPSVKGRAFNNPSALRHSQPEHSTFVVDGRHQHRAGRLLYSQIPFQRVNIQKLYIVVAVGGKSPAAALIHRRTVLSHHTAVHFNPLRYPSRIAALTPFNGMLLTL